MLNTLTEIILKLEPVNLIYGSCDSNSVIKKFLHSEVITAVSVGLNQYKLITVQLLTKVSAAQLCEGCAKTGNSCGLQPIREEGFSVHLGWNEVGGKGRGISFRVPYRGVNLNRINGKELLTY